MDQPRFAPPFRLLIAAAVLAAYLAAALLGSPRAAKAQAVAPQENAAAAALCGEYGPEGGDRVAASPSRSGDDALAAAQRHPPLAMVLPFVLLLLGIAVFPLVPRTAHWWESNWHRFQFAAGLAAATLWYYLCLADYPIPGHWPVPHITYPSQSGLNVAMATDVFANAILKDYIPFIALLLSLYTISGGIRIEGDLRAHPFTNTVFLAVGGVLASIIGTTGAAMLLIRPLLETNQERRHVKHTVVFFIFIVCNCGGCLLPTGDPPLLLGFLQGVPFFWTLALWKAWLTINGLLLLLYFFWDGILCYPQEPALAIARDETMTTPLRLRGLWPNVPLLLGVVVAVALLDPGGCLPGTTWHPWLYLREITEMGLIALSLLLGRREIRMANNFNYSAILEVAVLFFGIFLCMQPPLQILAVEGRNLGLSQPWHFFWASGTLSSVLDNAPTYLVFTETARSLTASLNLVPAVAGVHSSLLAAISLGAVLMGANTYIGNGPNFMVKAIAEQSGVRMPSFFGYLLYSGLILLPLFVLVTLLFFA